MKSDPNGFEMGPYDLEQLSSKLSSGAISRNYLIKVEGQLAWHPISSILTTAPPPEPPQQVPQSPPTTKPPADPRPPSPNNQQQQAAPATWNLEKIKLVGLGFLAGLILGAFFARELSNRYDLHVNNDGGFAWRIDRLTGHVEVVGPNGQPLLK